MNTEYLKRRRLAKGYSQYKLARVLNVSDSTVYSWENIGKCPRIDMLIKLCKLLDMDANILLNLKGECR